MASLLDQLELEELDEIPQPGRWFLHGSRSFLVLQRHHRYQLRNGRYELVTVALQVKAERQPREARWWRRRLGDRRPQLPLQCPFAAVALRRAA